MRYVEHMAVCVIEKRFPVDFLKLSTGGQRAGPFVNDSPPSADRVKVLLDFRSQGRILYDSDTCLNFGNNGFDTPRSDARVRPKSDAASIDLQASRDAHDES